jgi:hypothetical protein
MHEFKVIALETVREFLQEKKFPAKELKELEELLQKKLDFKENVHYVFIHPEPQDLQMFFGDHFTLDSKTLQQVAITGYKRAMATLRRYELIPL